MILEFRAYDKWGKSLIHPNEGDFIGWHAMSNWKDCLIVDQATSLKSDTGQKVFLNDIIEVLVNDPSTGRQQLYKGLVVQDEYGLCLETDDSSWPMISLALTSGNSIKILGNAHQNKDMLSFLSENTG